MRKFKVSPKSKVTASNKVSRYNDAFEMIFEEVEEDPDDFLQSIEYGFGNDDLPEELASLDYEELMDLASDFVAKKE